MSVQNARLALKRLPLVPMRQRGVSRPTSGNLLGTAARRAGDHFWQCSVEVAKVIYARIDARYPASSRHKSADEAKAHQIKMEDAKKILNEARNDVLEAVMPMFSVRDRKGNEEIVEADVHAHDYIVQNLFDLMVRTFVAWADHFVEQSEVEALSRNIEKVAALQRERLAGMLLHYVFEFRVIEKPKSD